MYLHSNPSWRFELTQRLRREFIFSLGTRAKGRTQPCYHPDCCGELRALVPAQHVSQCRTSMLLLYCSHSFAFQVPLLHNTILYLHWLHACKVADRKAQRKTSRPTGSDLSLQGTCRTGSHFPRIHPRCKPWNVSVLLMHGRRRAIFLSDGKLLKIRGIRVEELSLEFNKLQSRFISWLILCSELFYQSIRARAAAWQPSRHGH